MPTPPGPVCLAHVAHTSVLLHMWRVAADSNSKDLGTKGRTLQPRHVSYFVPDNSLLGGCPGIVGWSEAFLVSIQKMPIAFFEL